MKAIVQRRWAGVVVLAAGLAGPPGTGAQELTLGGDRGFYVGGSFGLSNVEIDGSSLRMEGIDFSNVSVDDNDLGTRIHAGYWITENIAVEAGFSDRGKVAGTFDFSDPRNGRTGSGETDVLVDTFDVCLLAALDLADVRLFAKVGYLGWTTDYETRFDVPGELSARRDFDQTGSDLVYGGGASWNFHTGWALRADAEFMSIDIADVQMFTIGLEYDFNALALR